MKSKKLIAAGLAVVMTAALAVPALAEDTVITGMYKEIKIDVEIPTAGEAVINPFEMPVKAMYKPETGDPVEVGALTTAGKISTQPLIGVSTCEVALDVGATVTGVVKGDLMLSPRPLGAVKTKSAVVYLECKQDTTLTKAKLATAGSEATQKPISGVIGEDAVKSFNAWPVSTYNFGTDEAAQKANANKVLVTEAGSTKLGLCTLAAAKKNNTTSEMEPQAGSFLLTRLGGDVVQTPTEAWTAADGVVVNVAFTFSPAAPRDGGAISATVTTVGTNKLAVAAPAGITFDSTETYKWEIIDGGTSNADAFDTTNNETTATPTLKAGTAAPTAGTVNLKCTVTLASGIKYVSTGSVTLTTT